MLAYVQSHLRCVFEEHALLRQEVDRAVAFDCGSEFDLAELESMVEDAVACYYEWEFGPGSEPRYFG